MSHLMWQTDSGLFPIPDEQDIPETVPLEGENQVHEQLPETMPVTPQTSVAPETPSLSLYDPETLTQSLHCRARTC